MGRVVEVQRGGEKHHHPHHHDRIQGHVEEIERQPLPRSQAGGLQERHGRHFLHDEERRVRQDEGVTRDVVAVPVETGLFAAHFGGEALLKKLQSFSFITGAGHVLDVEESLGADVPDDCSHHQREKPPLDEGAAFVEGGVGEQDERSQEEEGPSPGDFDEIPARKTTCYNIKLHISAVKKNIITA